MVPIHTTISFKNTALTPVFNIRNAVCFDKVRYLLRLLAGVWLTYRTHIHEQRQKVPIQKIWGFNSYHPYTYTVNCGGIYMQQSSISVEITKKSSLLFVSDSVGVIYKKTRFMVNIAFFNWLCRMILVFTNFKNNTNCINK